MSTRSAEATIKGYYYQFDTSILKLLELNNDADSITVEGIEDIDINTATDAETIQCKYLSKPKFINSSVREPIILMLDHCIKPTTPNHLIFALYAHFNDEPPGEHTIDLDKIKTILNYTENGMKKCHYLDNSITDNQLNNFLTRFKLIFGQEFKNQQLQVMQKLKTKFSCTDFEADTHFYNNALRIILDKAIIPDATQRQITKSQFLTAIDCRKKLFNIWYIKLRSKKEYLKSVKVNLRASKALLPSRSKYLFIGSDILNNNNSELPFNSFIQNIIDKYYKLNSALRNAKPVTLIIDCDKDTLLGFKKGLINNNIPFNDGYEEIEFNTDFFNSEPIINTTRNNTKIQRSSFLVKIISLETFRNNINQIMTPKVVLHFSKNECPYSSSDNYQYFDIKYCDNLKNLFNLLN
jgi:hypothetical protein